MESRKIRILISNIDTGFFVTSNDLPELNLFVQNEYGLVNAIPQAIKYLFKHNDGIDVRVLMEVPVFPDNSSEPEKIIQLEELTQAA